MTAPLPPPPAAVAPAAVAPAWGLREALAAWLVGLVASIAVGSAWLALTADQGIGFIAVSLATSWIGLIGGPMFLSARRGSGSVVRDFGLRFSWRDLPLGIAAAVVVGQVVGLVYLPLRHLVSDDDLARPARQLADDAGRGVGFVVLAVLVVVGAPLAEELFFRGLLQRAFVRRIGAVGGVLLTAVCFGAAHFQVAQFPALAVLGLVLGVLTHRTGRLGAAIVTHAVFNAVTVVALAATS